MFLFSLHALQIFDEKEVSFALKTEILVNNESYELYNERYQPFSEWRFNF